MTQSLVLKLLETSTPSLSSFLIGFDDSKDRVRVNECYGDISTVTQPGAPGSASGHAS